MKTFTILGTRAMTRNVRQKNYSRLALAAIFVMGITGLASCGDSAPQNSQKEVPAKEATQEIVPQIDGNTLTYGDHTYTVDGAIDFAAKDHKKPTASVCFTNVPADYAEFEAVYKGLLGKSSQGAAAMIPMALEMFARDHAVGEKCLQLLCNAPTTVSEMVRILKTKLEASQYGPENDQYLQRYMAAALLKGADSKNAYTPTEPYTVEMCSSPNGTKEAPLTGGTMYYLYILANGWDTFQRSVEIIQPAGSEYFKVFNCPATYSQCKTIVGEWAGLK